MILTLVDTTGIQSYIFDSNRLQENIGASYLVDLATGGWAKEAFDAVTGDEDRILYMGGGNFTALFESRERAEEFERRLSRRVLLEAPGLEVLTVHQERQGALTEDFDAAFARMALLKAERPRTAPLLGLGVTRNCRSTGLPAYRNLDIHGTSLAVAPEVIAKVEGFAGDGVRGKRMVDRAHDRLLGELVTGTLGMKELSLEFPRDFENLGATRGEQSYLAVVHADGNGMGDRIRQIAAQYKRDDTGYERAIRAFSDGVKDASVAALRATLTDLIGAIHHEVDDVREIPYPRTRDGLGPEFSIRLRKEGGRWYLPFRPIVYGGDDVTFVCDGRIGLPLAVAYLRHFETETAKLSDALLTEPGVGLTACAGVAIVKSHYPFARAYALAEELCRNAKRYRKAVQSNGTDRDLSALDWHFALSGLTGRLDEIRRREYTVALRGESKPRDLTLRPVILGANPNVVERQRSWAHVERTTRTFQSAQWHGKRNKLKALREALREGRDKVKEFTLLYRQKDEMLEPGGWEGDRCTLYDAVELADFYLPLREEASTTSGQPGGEQ
jgi:hypothetical protein